MRIGRYKGELSRPTIYREYKVTEMLYGLKTYTCKKKKKVSKTCKTWRIQDGPKTYTMTGAQRSPHLNKNDLNIKILPIYKM